MRMGLKKDYPWFDGKIQTETDLVNTKPLDPNKPGWKNVADRLRQDNPESHINTTDPNDPGMQSGNLNYEPDNPLNNPCFREILSMLPPPASMNWCHP
jgi:hypothetical protein